MATIDQFQAQLGAFDQATDNYINQLLDQTRGDRDLAIKILTRDHETALGTDNAARAQFLESVSDKLEQRIGRIPYDYEIATTRTREDLARTQEVTNRNKQLALQRLSEDEQVWRQDFAKTSADTRQAEAEGLSQRGLISGTREQAQGLAGREVARTEQDLGSTLTAFERALGRQESDIQTQAGDILTEAQTSAERQLQDLKTGARRGALDAQSSFDLGKEQQERLAKQREQELERQRTLGKLSNLSFAATGVS